MKNSNLERNQFPRRFRQQTLKAALALCVALDLGSSVTRATDYVFQEIAITIPGAVAFWVNGINASGDLVGGYFDGRASSGFALREGQIERIQIPGARFTLPSGINNLGDIVGYTLDAGFHPLPFLWKRDGSYAYLSQEPSAALGINASGVAVGYTYYFTVGTIYKNGTVSFFSYPLPGYTATVLTGINGRGDFVGGVALFDETFPAPGEDPVNQSLAFIVDKNGPRILATPSRYAQANGINGSGSVCGTYVLAVPNSTSTDEIWLTHGFIANDAQLETVDVPGSFDPPLTLTVDDPDFGPLVLQRINAGTVIQAINDRGQIVAKKFASYLEFDFYVSRDIDQFFLGTPVD